MDAHEERNGDHRAVDMMIGRDDGTSDRARAVGRRNGNDRTSSGSAPDRVEMLIDQLGSPDADRRRKAAEALGNLNDRRALAPLVALSVNDDSSVADAAVTAVGRLGGGSALAALQSLIPVEGSRNPTPRSKERRRGPEHRQAVERSEALGVLLADPDPDVRGAALAVLGKVDDPRAMGLAIVGLRDSDAGVRRVAAQILGELGTAVATESLLSALDDSDPTVRCAVIDALGEIGDLRAAEALLVVAQRPRREDPGSGSDAQAAARRALERLALLHPGTLGAAGPD